MKDHSGFQPRGPVQTQELPPGPTFRLLTQACPVHGWNPADCTAQWRMGALCVTHYRTVCKADVIKAKPSHRCSIDHSFVLNTAMTHSTRFLTERPVHWSWQEQTLVLKQGVRPCPLPSAAHFCQGSLSSLAWKCPLCMCKAGNALHPNPLPNNPFFKSPHLPALPKTTCLPVLFSS